MGVINVSEFQLGKTQGIKLTGETNDLKRVVYYHHSLVGAFFNKKNIEQIFDTLEDCDKEYLYVYDIKGWNKIFTDLRLHLAIDGVQLKRTETKEIPF